MKLILSAFFVFALLAPLKAAAHESIYTLNSPALQTATPNTFSEEIDSQGRIVENYRGFHVFKFPQGIPDQFESWEGHQKFLARRKVSLKALSLVLSMSRVLPVGSMAFLRNEFVSSFQRFFNRGGQPLAASEFIQNPTSRTGKLINQVYGAFARLVTVDENLKNFRSKTLPELSFETKERLMNSFNDVLWKSKTVITEGNEFSASMIADVGYGFAREPSDSYKYGAIAITVGFNKAEKGIFIEVVRDWEKLIDVTTLISEVTVIGLRGALSVSHKNESNVSNLFGEIDYDLGLGAIARGPEFLQISGSLPLVGAISWPPLGLASGYIYKTRWERRGILRFGVSLTKWPSVSIDPSLKAGLKKMGRSCASVFLHKQTLDPF